jgi:hypothetical protein
VSLIGFDHTLGWGRAVITGLYDKIFTRLFPFDHHPIFCYWS